jgi:hypothetical protein
MQGTWSPGIRRGLLRVATPGVCDAILRFAQRSDYSLSHNRNTKRFDRPKPDAAGLSHDETA